MEVRYPFCDVRLVNYLLAIPVLPWRLHKELLRVALRGQVPETVCRRPKTPLSRDPFRFPKPAAEDAVAETAPFLPGSGPRRRS